MSDSKIVPNGVPESSAKHVRELWQGALSTESDPGATIRPPSTHGGEQTWELVAESDSAGFTLELISEGTGGDQTLVLPEAESDAPTSNLSPVISSRPSFKATTVVSSSASESFTLMEPVGKGGMGVVWRAEQTGLNRSVAIKLPLAANVDDPQFVAEAQVTGYLEHPNVPFRLLRVPLCAIVAAGLNHTFFLFASYRLPYPSGDARKAGKIRIKKQFRGEFEG